MKISKLERLALGVGRLRRMLKGVDAPLADPYAWTSGPMWGEGVSANRKVTTKQQGIDAFLSWVYICANLNARAVASVPLELYVSNAAQGQKWQTIKTRRVDKARVKWLTSNQGLRRYIRKAEEVEQVTEHPFLDLMSHINPFMNRSDLFEYTTLYMDLAKESYWYVIRDGIGVPTELWPVPSQFMRPLPGKTTKDYIRAYEYQRGRVKVEFGVDEIIRIAYPNLNNHLSGYSVVQGIADAVYTNTEMYAYEESLFEKKARVGGVLQSDAAVSETEVKRMREDWAQHQAGTANAGQTAILPPGVKWARDGYTNEELSFPQGRMMIREEIAAGFDTPIAIWDKTATRANVEGAQYTHARYGILPRLRKIEEKINEQLIPMFDDSGRLFCAFENPVPEDKAFLLQKRQVDLGAGVSTINEERSEDGKEPVDGGDEPLVSSLVVPLSQAIAEPEPIPPQLAPGLNPEDGADEEKPKRKPKPGAADEDGDAEADADAEKIVALTIAKLKERLLGGQHD